MNNEKINQYINRCKILQAQSVYIINNPYKEKDINSFFTLLAGLVDDLEKEKFTNNLILSKLEKILQTRSYKSSNKIIYKMQLFFIDWYCGIIGNDSKLIAFKTSNTAVYINDIKDQIQAITYYLENIPLN